MLKRALIDNKIANINDKNCSLCIVLAAMDQKLQIIKVILLSISLTFRRCEIFGMFMCRFFRALGYSWLEELVLRSDDVEIMDLNG